MMKRVLGILVTCAALAAAAQAQTSRYMPLGKQVPPYTDSGAQPYGGVLGDPQTTGPKSTDAVGQFLDGRYGVPQWIFNGSQAYDTRHAASPTFAFNFIGNSGLTGTSTHAGGPLRILSNWWMGGRNFYNDKMNAADVEIVRNHYTNVQDGNGLYLNANCYGNGDCLGRVLDIKAYGGSNTGGDQGAEAEQVFVATGNQVFSGTLAAGLSVASDGTSTFNVTSPVANSTQGEGRPIFDVAKVYNAGYISSISATTDETVTCSGCDWDGTFGTGTKTTLTAAVANPVSGTNSFPQSNTQLHVASTLGFLPGDTTGIWDRDWECEKVESVDGVNNVITIYTDRIPHSVGAYVTRGGLTCAAFEFEADRLSPSNKYGIQTASNQGSGPQQTIRQVFPVMYNTAGNHLYLFTSANSVPGGGGNYGGRAYAAMGGSGGTCSVTLSGGAIASVTVAGGTGYISALDPPQLVLSGITYTTAPVISVSGVTGGALTSATINNAGAGISGTPACTVTTSNPYDIYYAAAHVRQVYNATTGAVDGSKFVTEPWSSTPASGDTLEEPLYFYQHVTATSYDEVGQYFPTLGPASASIYGGNCIGILHSSDNCVIFSSTTDPALFQGYPVPRNTLGYGQLIAPQWGYLRGPARQYWTIYEPPLGGDANSLSGDGFEPAGTFVGCGALPCASWVHWYWLYGGATKSGAAGVRVNPSLDAADVTAPVRASLTETTTGCSVAVYAGQFIQSGCSPATLQSSAWWISGQENNYSANSTNVSAATWFSQGSSGGLTMTPTSGQTDPWGGTAGTKLVYSGGTGCPASCNYYWDDGVPAGGTNLTAGTSYTVCAVLKGDVGGEIVSIGIGPSVVAAAKTLTTSAANYCVTQVPDALQLNRTFQISSQQNQTVYFYGVCTTTQSTCLPPSIATGSTQITAIQAVTWSPTVPSVSASASTGHASCLKATAPPVLGTCSTQPDAGGACTCN